MLGWTFFVHSRGNCHAKIKSKIEKVRESKNRIPPTPEQGIQLTCVSHAKTNHSHLNRWGSILADILDYLAGLVVRMRSRSCGALNLESLFWTGVSVCVSSCLFIRQMVVWERKREWRRGRIRGRGRGWGRIPNRIQCKVLGGKTPRHSCLHSIWCVYFWSLQSMSRITNGLVPFLSRQPKYPSLYL